MLFAAYMSLYVVEWVGASFIWEANGNCFIALCVHAEPGIGALPALFG